MAGYPLLADLDLKAKSVHDAITALGTYHPLATINVDAFRNHFIEEEESYILHTMDADVEKKTLKRDAEKGKAEPSRKKRKQKILLRLGNLCTG